MAFSGEKLREVRKQRGKTQWAVAKPMGIPSHYVSRWENGRSAPSGENMVRLLEVLGCKLEDVTE